MTGAIILGYHRICVLPRVDALSRGLEVPAALFRRHLEILARRFLIVPLEQLVARLASGAEVDGLAAVTLDDGYEDNYSCALPVCSRTGVPATVFLTTDNVEGARPFWTDRLAAYLCGSAGAVVAVPAQLGGRLDLTTPDGVRRSYERLRIVLSGMAACAREGLLDLVDAGNGAAGRPLSWEQIRTMQRQGIAFGAHTRSHPSLPRLSDAAVRAEIDGSRDLISARLGAPPATFAYPFGDADERVSAIVEAAGFRGAVTTSPGRCQPGVRPSRLPRLMVGAWSGPEFERRVEAHP